MHGPSFVRQDLRPYGIGQTTPMSDDSGAIFSPYIPLRNNPIMYDVLDEQTRANIEHMIASLDENAIVWEWKRFCNEGSSYRRSLGRSLI